MRNCCPSTWSRASTARHTIRSAPRHSHQETGNKPRVQGCENRQKQDTAQADFRMSPFPGIMNRSLKL